MSACVLVRGQSCGVRISCDIATTSESWDLSWQGLEAQSETLEQPIYIYYVVGTYTIRIYIEYTKP